MTLPLDEKNDTSKQLQWKITDSAYFKIFRNRKYLIWTLSMGLVFLSFPIPYTFTIKYAKLMTAKIKPELLLSTIGLGSIIGRAVLGFISDFKNLNRLIMQQITIGHIPAEPALSFCISFTSIPVLFGPIIAGLIIDKTNNYKKIFKKY
ncbi:hypothetical protein A3Q56_06202 [Intoshia linei]|uniref:Major facilitator superfamily (MFS) profile domain-containing protein n=1 Tax=Intoshia linei TaxID=1819745 RepID=A0A177AXH9_9BILA|nr:hypothetical protein A3Q56_06202 [Intoshia linei]